MEMTNLAKIKASKPINELLNFSLINIDKPSGPTSFQVSQHVKKALGLTKTSHFGTLDPMVSGILPIGLNRACRLSDYFMHKNKVYVGIMRLHEPVSSTDLEAVIKKFLGTIKQLPPVRSRVKRAVREREINSFIMREQEGTDVLFETEVQAGTYIRKLIHDIGQEIGGAHMLELRRIQAGIFKEPGITLYEFDKAVEAWKRGDESFLRGILIPAPEALMQILPVAEIRETSIKQLLTGKPLMEHDLQRKGEVAERFIVVNEDRFIGVYKKAVEEYIIARPEFVFN
ncbi:RNA-guided pseudouridylation complex pseudouridine synthase subunit Cbf5 [Candidatus Pacearchaeota archaeon]|nr:RNA-guided pseudouridylation complex pseudouridine synthase subunit Cbf5 [Candidatus Pacearchaeota archaeon]